MTKEEEQWFDKLTEEHRKDAKTFAKPNYRQLWDRLVDMYKESAHFVYELIQNADDAEATEAHFLLYKDKLIFRHNGRKKFTVSNPETEEEDRKKGNLGHLNSITSVAFSSKNNEDEPSNSIGKFGIGFKSIYTYTNNPEIYDQTMCFRIEQKIIPIRLDHFCDNWKKDETWFVIPFDNPQKPQEKACSEILNQLSDLHNPTLFLNHLEIITYQYDDEQKKGEYRKDKKQHKEYNDGTDGKLWSLIHNIDGEQTKELIWVFTRKKDNALTYSVGFGIKDNKLIPRNDYAYCYFQTKEETHLNFAIHAPFLLTPDRQHIKDGEDHNTQMIALLAKLAADSMVYLRDIGAESGHNLIDDDILKIIPIKSSDFYFQTSNYNPVSHRREVSNVLPKTFEPFYDCILNKFKNDNLLPAKNEYSYASNAFWAEDTSLIELFPDEDLSKINHVDNAHWIFRSLRGSGTSDDCSEWIENVISPKHYLNENDLLQNISASFCEEKFKNSLDWFDSFYEWLDSAKERTNIAKESPFFIDESGKGVNIFINGTLDLFLPTGEKNDYHTVNKELCEKGPIRAFLQKLGVKEPSFRDEIYSKILPRYRNEIPDEEQLKSDFRKIIKYYNECPNSDSSNFFKQINVCLLFRCFSNNNETLLGKADEIYFENDDLNIWFKNKPEAKFLDYNFYTQFADANTLNCFFEKIGIQQTPRIVEKKLNQFDMNQWNSGYTDIVKLWLQAIDNKQTAPNSVIFTFCTLDGIDEVLENISKDTSCLLWKYLISSIDTIKTNASIHYRYNKSRDKDLPEFFIPLISKLNKEKWLYTKEGIRNNPKDIFLNDISDIYNTQSFESNKLIAAFSIKARPAIDESKLPEEVKNKLATYDRLKEAGIEDLTDEEIEEIKQMRLVKSKTSSNHDGTTSSFTEKTTNNSNGCSNNATKSSLQDKIAQEIADRSKERNPQQPKLEIEEHDSDEWTPPSFNSERQIEKAKEKLAVELNRIAELEKAKKDATKADRYSYQWFKSMLQLEILRSNENNQNSKEVHISFGKVTIDPDPKSQKTLILSQPNKKIPAFIEELYGINLIVHFRGDKPDRSITFEAASIRSFTLRLKMMRDDDVKSLDVDDISSAEIIAKSPVFLLQELQKQFDHLEIDDSANLKHFLCENIRFIFGPPGTGKTTFLAEKVLKPWIKENAECNILVLAPTNKAADVLTKRIMEKTENYSDFLLRFGTTGDEVIENSGVFCNRSFDISKRTQNIVVTTIARLPYDSFVKEGHESLFIRDVKWDYIVVDEASMIPLVQMVYLLYSQKPKGFVIAGDPFQIEPTVAEDSWKKENIYEMVELKDFANHTTKPHSYEVETLETQYRSIPKVGEIYSKLTYNNILKHNRDEAERKPLEIDNLDIQPLNLIKFPVSEYESIYRSKRLGRGSSYQIYSALFTFEFTSHLVDSIVKKYPGKEYSIGIVSPYKAEADLIGNLLRSKKFPDEISVLSGTVHSFQGDECDIMLTVFNTPEYISKGDGMFLNHKNIVNVAISRARDYLFVLMPDEKTKNIENLGLINQMEKYMEESGICKRFGSHELEKWMFDSESYLEENAFSTGHQSVNVYGEPEKRYEIRSEDDAIDIQVHQE